MGKIRCLVPRLAALSLALTLAPLSAAAQEGNAPSGGLSVTEVQLGTALEGGRIATPGTEFSRSAGRLFAVVRLTNPSGEATSIRVSFERVDGPAADGVSLDIPATRRYRTVARTGTGRPAGRYRCVVRDAAGAELASVEYTLTE
ncbi:MAG: hypothetical protein AB7S26_03645 [Sandaracinaceae bacterium]